MSSLRRLASTLAVLVVASSPAMAMKITNSDEGEHTVTIVSGEKSTEHKLAGGASVEDACESGCKVSVAGTDGEFEAASGDELVVSEGKVGKDE